MATEVLKIAGVRLKLEGEHEFQASMNQATHSLKMSEGQLKLYQEKQKGAGQTTVSLTKEIQHLTTQQYQHENRLKAMQGAYAEYVKQQGTASREARILKERIVEEKVALEQTNNKLEEATIELDKMSWGLKRTSEGWQDLGQKMQTQGQKISDFGGKLTKVVTTTTVGLATAGVKFAAELQAQDSQFAQVFGDLESAADSAVDRIAEETGSLPNRIKPAFTQMTAFAKSAGMETADALSMSERATLAAADSAAFYDRSLEDATASLQSFLKGNYANDAALGISATETTRNTKANELYGESFKDLDEAQKQLTLLAMVEEGNQLSGAIGQAARESDELVNQLGNLQQQAKDTLAEIAAPLMEPTIDVMKRLGEVLGNIAKWFGDLTDEQQQSIVNMALFATAAGPAITVLGKLHSGIGGAIESFVDLNDKIKTGTGLVGKLGSVMLGSAGFVGLFAAATASGIGLHYAMDDVDRSLNNVYKSIIRSKDNFSAQVGSIETNAELTYQLGEELEALAAKESLTAEEMGRAKIAAEQFNSLMPDMNVSINEQSGAVEGLAEDWRDLAEEQKEHALITAYTRSYEKLAEAALEAGQTQLDAKRKLEEQMQLEGVSWDTLQERISTIRASASAASGATGGMVISTMSKLVSAYDDYKTATDAVGEVNAEIEASYEDMIELLGTFGITVEDVATANEDAADDINAAGDGVTENAEKNQKKLEALSDAEKERLEDLTSTIEDHHDQVERLTDEHHNELNRLTDEGFKLQELTMDGWLGSMEKRQTASLKVQENLAILKGRDIPQGMLAELAAAGPEYSKLIEELATANDDDLEGVVKVWQENALLARTLALSELDMLEPASAESARYAADAIIDEWASRAEEFLEAGESVPLEVREGLNIATPYASFAARKLANAIRREIEAADDNAGYIGMQIALGLEKGINDSAWRPVDAAAGMAGSVNATLTRIAQTESPSKFTKQIGLWYGEGYAIGIEGKISRVEGVIKQMADTVNAETVKMNKQLTADLKQLDEDYQYDREKTLRSHNNSIADIRQKAIDENRSLTTDEQWDLQDKERSHKRDMLDMEQRYQQDRLDMIEQAGLDVVAAGEQYIKDQQWIGQMSIQEEIIYWNQMYRALESGSAAYEQALSNHQSAVARLRSQIESAMSDYGSQMTQITTSYQSELKRIEEDHAKESARIAEQRTSAIASASEKAASSRLQAAENYASSRKQIEEKLVSDLAALDQQYADSLDNRTKQLANFAGLFERWLHPAGVPEGQLLQNIKSQVEGLQAYEDVMVSLEDKISSEALIEELRELGPGSISELEALNRMSDDQLNEFVSLYEERFRLASERAVVEMEPLKDDLSRQAEELRKQTAIDLDNLYKEYQQALARINAEMRSAQAKAIADARAAQKQLDEDAEAARKKLEEDTEAALTELEEEWIERIKAIVLGTEEQFDSLYQVGVDAIDGLKRGMDSAAPALYARADAIAAKVASTIANALEIHSPSRLLMRIGQEIPAGMAIGIDKDAYKAIRSAEEMTQGVIKAAQQDYTVYMEPSYSWTADDMARIITALNGYQMVNQASAAAPVINQDLTIISPEPLSPSETARQLKNSSRQLAMELR